MSNVLCPHRKLLVEAGPFCNNCARPIPTSPSRGGVNQWWKQQSAMSRIGVVLVSCLVIGMAASLFQAKKSSSEAPPSTKSDEATPAPKVKPELDPRPIIDITRLAGKSAAELQRALGKPVGLTKITSNQELMPGEYRDYKVDGALTVATPYGLTVRFFKGRAVHFTLDLQSFSDTPEKALLLAGFDVRGAIPRIKASRATRWTGRFGGIDFTDVAAIKAGKDQNYTTIQVEVAM